MKQNKFPMGKISVIFVKLNKLTLKIFPKYAIIYMFVFKFAEIRKYTLKIAWIWNFFIERLHLWENQTDQFAVKYSLVNR